MHIDRVVSTKFCLITEVNIMKPSEFKGEMITPFLVRLKDRDSKIFEIVLTEGDVELLWATWQEAQKLRKEST